VSWITARRVFDRGRLRTHTMMAEFAQEDRRHGLRRGARACVTRLIPRGRATSFPGDLMVGWDPHPAPTSLTCSLPASVHRWCRCDGLGKLWFKCRHHEGHLRRRAAARRCTQGPQSCSSPARSAWTAPTLRAIEFHGPVIDDLSSRGAYDHSQHGHQGRRQAGLMKATRQDRRVVRGPRRQDARHPGPRRRRAPTAKELTLTRAPSARRSPSRTPWTTYARSRRSKAPPSPRASSAPATNGASRTSPSPHRSSRVVA